jgi:sugar lactone lactonase YvrE
VLDDPIAFWGPRGITVDAEGRVYVADTGNKRIQVFSDQGNFELQIGRGGTLPGELDEPVGLDIGLDGNLYVADTWNQRIEVFDPTGGFVRMWAVDAWYAQTNERPYLDVDALGNVYVTDPEAFRIIVFDTLGNYRYSFGDSTSIGLAGAVVADNHGHLFVVDTGAGAILRYDINALETGLNP